MNMSDELTMDEINIYLKVQCSIHNKSYDVLREYANAGLLEFNEYVNEYFLKEIDDDGVTFEGDHVWGRGCNHDYLFARIPLYALTGPEGLKRAMDEQRVENTKRNNQRRLEEIKDAEREVKHHKEQAASYERKLNELNQVVNPDLETQCDIKDCESEIRHRHYQAQVYEKKVKELKGE